MSSLTPDAKATKSTSVRKPSVKKYKATGAAKSTAKASSKPAKAAAATPSHPTWKEIIIECITTHRDDARTGVSRNTIKKFAEERYGLDTSGANLYQLNRAITSGAEKGTFALPKGPSGKVKLAPKAKAGASKENSKPSSTRKAAPPAKKSTTSTKAAVTKKPAAAAAPAKKKQQPAKKATTTTTSKKPAATATKKAPSSTSRKTATSAKKPISKTITKKTSSAKTGEKKVAAKSAAITKSRTRKSK